MISEKDLEELQKIPLDERVKRVEALLEKKENPRGFESLEGAAWRRCTKSSTSGSAYAAP